MCPVTIAPPPAPRCAGPWDEPLDVHITVPECGPRPSDWQRVNACSRSSIRVTGRMPRPPPPAMAFTITAPPSPSEARNSRASSRLVGPDVPGSTGTPSSAANASALPLSPKRSSTSACGPTNVSPAAEHRRANAAFSLRKPYPGWMASQPAATAVRTISSASRYAAAPCPLRQRASSAFRTCSELASSSE